MVNILNYNDTQKLIFISCIIYLFCPLFGIVVLLVSILSGNNNKRLLFYFFILLALYMGLINSTKIPVTDQAMYYEAYKLVPNRSLWENLTGIYGTHGKMTTKEMGFGLLNVIGYYITFGSYPLFITLFTFILYMLYYYAIYNWFKFLNIRKVTLYIVSAVITLTFFTQFFNLTIHLQRQMIATAVIIFSIIQTIVKGKIQWLWVLIAISLHTSVGLFLPLFVIIFFIKKITRKLIIIILGGFAVLISVLNYIATSLLNSLGGDIYALNRLQSMGNSQEDAMATGLVMLVSLPLAFISIKDILTKEKCYDNNSIILYLFYLFNIIFSIFNPDNTMQYRYFMMSYGFIPFILPLLSWKINFGEKIYLLIIPVFFFFRFYFTFEQITFRYAPIEYVLLGNVFTLFNYNYI